MTSAPSLGTRVVHVASNRHGEVRAFHGRLTDYLYVLFDDAAKPELVAIEGIERELGEAA